MRRRRLLARALPLSFAAAAMLAPPVAAVAGQSVAAAQDAPSAQVRVEPPTPRPALKTPKAGTWPFAPWSYAKAYTYNFFPAKGGVLINVVAPDGTWNAHMRSEQLISEKQGLTAAALVDQSQGAFELSKCFFPRHAVVLFDQADKPVGAANICFECEGISVWPNYDKRPEDLDYEAGEAVLAKWRTLFGDELGLPVKYQEALF